MNNPAAGCCWSVVPIDWHLHEFIGNRINWIEFDLTGRPLGCQLQINKPNPGKTQAKPRQNADMDAEWEMLHQHLDAGETETDTSRFDLKNENRSD